MRYRLREQLVEFEVPSFDTDDVRALLEAWGAPSTINNEVIAQLIRASSAGHPQLVYATVSWLYETGWQTSPGMLDSLLSGDPARQVRQDYLRLIPSLIPEQSTREFLYRLSVVSHPFTTEIARLVANVEPEIGLAAERLARLNGPWVTQLSGTLFEASSLVREIDQDNLSKSLVVGIHAAVADKLLSESSIPIQQITNIVSHLFASNQGNRLAMFIIQMTNSVKTQEQANYLVWMTGLFLDDAPRKILVDAELMIGVRACQVRLKMMGGKNSAGLLADLDRRIGEINIQTELAVAMVGFAYLNTGIFIDSVPAIIGLRQSVKFVRLTGQYPSLMEGMKTFESADGGSPWHLAWFSMMRATALQEYLDILELLETLSSEEVTALFANTMVDETPYIWLDKLWNSTADQQPTETVWNDILGVFQRFQDLAYRAHLSRLLVATKRSRAIVYADYLKKTDDAIKEFQGELPEKQATDEFMIAYTTASILSDAGRHEEAIPFYEDVYRQKSEAFSYYRFDTMRRLTEACGKSMQWGLSAAWCIKTILYGRQRDLVPLDDQIEMLGELAWIRWSQGKFPQAAAAMYAAAKLSLEFGSAPSQRRKEVLIKLGHVMGWMTFTKLGGDDQAIRTIEGEPYIKPFPGLISRRRGAIAQLDRPGIYWLYYQLGLFAERSGAARLSWVAFSKAIELAETAQLKLLVASIDMSRVTLAARHESSQEALRIALSGAQYLGVMGVKKFSSQELASSHESLDEAWYALDQKARGDAQRPIFWLSFAPAVCAMLELEIPSEEAREKLGLWKSAFATSSLVEDREYWERMTALADLVFQPDLGRDAIQLQRPQNDQDSYQLRFVWYIALSVQQNAPLNEIAKAQAIVYAYVLDNPTTCRYLKLGLGLLIMNTWRYILKNRGFYLRNPMKLRRLISEETKRITDETVARILLTATDAVGTELDASVNSTLNSLRQTNRG